jgi:hypothetical protein
MQRLYRRRSVSLSPKSKFRDETLKLEETWALVGWILGEQFPACGTGVVVEKGLGELDGLSRKPFR